MKKYTFEISIQAQTPQEAGAKIKSLATIGSKLTTKELNELGEVVSNPLKMEIARQKLGL